MNKTETLLQYSTVAEMHIFLSEVDLSQLASRSRVLTQVSQSIDNDLVD